VDAVERDQDLSKAVSFTATGGLKSMTMTTGIQSVSIPVADQDRALAFYTEVLGCELRHDVEVWPGARFVEVVPPGSTVGLVLLPPDSEIPMAVRLRTPDAESAHERLRATGATLHNDKIILLDGFPPMFFFADPDGNGLVYLEEEGSPTDSFNR
jgi:catechol 2,3-dioxygenase-like lactoylglutathione lyase family enzyme